MKPTARDWLLKHHAHAQARLNKLRQYSLPPQTKIEDKPLATLSWADFLKELFYPSRHLWYSFAAVWLLLLLIQLGLPGHAPRSADQNKASPRHLSTSIAQLHALLNETSTHP